MSSSLLLLPERAAPAIRSGGRYGDIVCAYSAAEELAAVIKLRVGNGPMLPTEFAKPHWLNGADKIPVGRWYEVPSELHGIWWYLRHGDFRR